MFFVVFLFLIMPFAHSGFLQDSEQSPRFLFLSMLLTLYSGYMVFISDSKKEPRWFKIPFPRLHACFFLFILITFISIFSSRNPGEALFYFFKSILFFLFFIIIQALLYKDGVMKQKLLMGINIFIPILITAALIQVFPQVKNYFQSGKPISIDYTVSSLLGNKNFFAETIFLSLPFVLISFLYLNVFWKYVSAFNIIIVLLSLLILRTLSVWMAALVCFLTGIILMFVFRKKLLSLNILLKRKTILVILSGGIIIISAGIFLIKETGGLNTIRSKLSIAKGYFVNTDKLLNDNSINSNSVYERLVLWRNSLRMIKEKPFTGIGLSDWKTDFPNYGSARADIFNSVNIRFQHPHNDYLFIAAESGIFALLFYILFFISAIYLAVQIIISSEEVQHRIESLILLMGIIGFLIISLFSMPLMRYYPVILVMIMISFIINDYSRLNGNKVSFLNNRTIKIILFCGFLISSISVFAGIKRWTSDWHLSNALNAQRGNNFGRMKRELNSMNTFIYPMDNFGSPVAWHKGIADFYKGDQDHAFKMFRDAEKINPYHFHLLNDLGSCYNLSGNVAVAKEYYRKTLAIAPQYVDALVNLSVVYYNEGNIDSAYSTITEIKKPTEKSIKLLDAILKERNRIKN